MIILAVQVELRAAWVHSLKEKRRILRSLLDRLRRYPALAVAEVGAQDQHQQIMIGLACVSGSASTARTVMDQAIRLLDQEHQLEIVYVTQEEHSLI